MECVRCGACKTQCPTYDTACTETLSPRGRIAILNAIMGGEIEATRSALEKIESCLHCLACTPNCPPGINIPEIIYSGLSLLRERTRRKGLLRLLVHSALLHPGPYFAAASFARGPVERYLKRRTLIPEDLSLPGRSLRTLPQVIEPERPKKGRVAIFRGCSTNYIFTGLGRSLIRVLLRLGYEVVMPRSEVCCGSPLRSLGMEKEAIRFARKNVETFSRLKADAVISLCPTCILAIREEYPLMISRGIENAMDITAFLLAVPALDLGPLDGSQAFYHDPCHMRYGLKITEEPREILRRCGIEAVSGDRQQCCGFGGIFSMKFRDYSLMMAGKVAEEIERTGAGTVVTSCPGCMLQLRKILRGMEVLHVVEVLEKATGEPLLL